MLLIAEAITSPISTPAPQFAAAHAAPRQTMFFTFLS